MYIPSGFVHFGKTSFFILTLFFGYDVCETSVSSDPNAVLWIRNYLFRSSKSNRSKFLRYLFVCYRYKDITVYIFQFFYSGNLLIIFLSKFFCMKPLKIFFSVKWAWWSPTIFPAPPSTCVKEHLTAFYNFF